VAGATSEQGVDDTCDKHQAGRRHMIRAFVSMSETARRLGADEYAISELHGWFFDGHVLVKDSFRTAALLARLYEARAGVADEGRR
jgi:hypothetical protein